MECHGQFCGFGVFYIWMLRNFFSPIMYYLYDIFCGRRASMCMEEKLVCLLFF